LAPVFFSAYDYVLLGGAIRHIGAQYSVLRPGWYFTCFLIADVISLILQAVGGGQAASSAATGEPTVTATNIMVAGIIFQLISMVVFVALGFDFVLRASTRRSYVFRQRQIAAATLKSKSKASEKSGDLSQTPSDETSSDEIRPETQTVGEDVEGRQNLTRWWTMLSGAMISSIMILIRGVYRSIELRQGWSGFLITHQIYQSTLDGLPMFIAVATFNFIHPWFVLGRKLSWKGYH